MNTRSTFRGFLIGFFLVFLAACSQKSSENPRDIEERLRQAPPKTFLIDEKGNVTKVGHVAAETDEITSVNTDGAFGTMPIRTATGRIVEIVVPDHQNYAAYERMFPGLQSQDILRKAGQGAIALMADGSVMVIVNPTYEYGIAMVSKSIGTRQTLSTDDIVAKAVNIVSPKTPGKALNGYDELCATYVSGTRLRPQK
ncbi:MAG TPA: hypothetical protein VN420_01895 [Candidatus Fimivivens sp.]|nr:hypothetical protein [Candidatus Fimivivens sp.]